MSRLLATWIVFSMAYSTALTTGPSVIAAEPHGIEIIGHRGASWDAPENTVSAIKLAWEQQADGAEFDVYLTKDGKIVACHDKDTKRTAGVVKVIANTTLVELRKLDVGTWKDPRFGGERIPTLEEMLATVPAGKRVYIEVKCGPEIVPELDRVLRMTKLKPSQTPVICFDDKVIAAVKKLRPDLPAYWLVSLKAETKANALIANARKIHADGLDLSANKHLDQKFAETIREAGLGLIVWTVNDPALARRLRAMGVQGITTDRPAWLRTQMDE